MICPQCGASLKLELALGEASIPDLPVSVQAEQPGGISLWDLQCDVRTYNAVRFAFESRNPTLEEILELNSRRITNFGVVCFMNLVENLLEAGVLRTKLEYSQLWMSAPLGWRMRANQLPIFQGKEVTQ